MKHGWTEAALGEVVEATDRPETPESGKKYRQLGVRLWGAGAYERATIDGENTNYSFFNRCEQGDLVVSKIWARNGSVSVIQPELEGCFVSGEFPIFKAKNTVSTGWLKLITKARWFWHECHLKAQGTSGKNRIKPAKFLEIKIPLPPLTEQQRIVAHLDAIEERLNRIQKLREESEKELLAALRSAFHEIETESNWVEMQEVAPLVRREVEIELDARYTEFGIKSFYKGIFLRRSMSGDAYDWQKLFWLKEGDVVFSNIMAWEKAIGLATAENDGWVGNHRMLTCEPNREKVLPSWLYFYFTTSKGFSEIERASPGTAARNKTLKADSLSAIQIPLPRIEAQERFERLFQLHNKQQKQRTLFEPEHYALIPSLLDRIFNKHHETQ